MLEKRYRTLLAKDLRAWLQELVSSGQKQNILWSKPNLSFKKRFLLDYEELQELPDSDGPVRVSVKFPQCVPHMHAFFEEWFWKNEANEALRGFGLEFETGSVKSFVISITKEGFEHYLNRAGLSQFASDKRIESVISKWLTVLGERNYDLPQGLPHWKIAQSTLRAMENYEDLTLEWFTKLKVGKSLVPLRLHPDRKVSESSTGMLRKFKRLHDEKKAEDKIKEEAKKAV